VTIPFQQNGSGENTEKKRYFILFDGHIFEGDPSKISLKQRGSKAKKFQYFNKIEN
jgi:hypothetical protein